MHEEILQILEESEEPMYLAEIAKKLKETSQLVQYHLNAMVDEGILITFLEDRKRYYALQPVQYKYTPSALYEFVMPLLQDMANYVKCDQSTESSAKILANNLVLILDRFADDIETLFDETNDFSEDT